jgi:hypothetical protein
MILRQTDPAKVTGEILASDSVQPGGSRIEDRYHLSLRLYSGQASIFYLQFSNGRLTGW